ncbi:MAG: aromatic amino acid transport family protein [Candidatus Woesearchaeota archaeon]
MEIRWIKTSATLIGGTVGAGILGIPYVFAKAGFLTGLACIGLTSIMITLLNLFIGEIALRTNGERHQLTAYAERFLGKNAKHIVMGSTLFMIYGAMLAYIIKSGELLSMLLGGNSFNYSVIFFSIIAFLIYLGPKRIRDLKVGMVVLSIIFIFIIFFFAIPRIRVENLLTFQPEMLFLPYGVVLFAMIGMHLVPEVRKELAGNERDIKKAIILGSITPALLYVIFAVSVVGISGLNTSEASIQSIWFYFGDQVGRFAAAFAVLVMATAFLSLGIALRDIYVYDYNKDSLFAWFATCFVPILFFLFVKNFIAVLSITGAVAGGIISTTLILVYIMARKKSEREPEYSIKINKAWLALLIFLFTLGTAYEIALEFGILNIH